MVGMHHGYFKADEEEPRRGDIASGRARHPVRRDDLAAQGAVPGALEPRARAFPSATASAGRSTFSPASSGGRPRGWQRLGLEWLYRVKQEPGRLWKRYLVTNSAFVAMVIAAYCRQQLARLPLASGRVSNP